MKCGGEAVTTVGTESVEQGFALKGGGNKAKLEGGKLIGTAGR